MTEEAFERGRGRAAVMELPDEGRPSRSKGPALDAVGQRAPEDILDTRGGDLEDRHGGWSHPGADPVADLGDDEPTGSHCLAGEHAVQSQAELVHDDVRGRDRRDEVVVGEVSGPEVADSAFVVEPGEHRVDDR